MKRRITPFQRKYILRNPFVQIFMFIYYNFKIMKVVTTGHGGARTEKKEL
jgi:hypothetical protein